LRRSEKRVRRKKERKIPRKIVLNLSVLSFSFLCFRLIERSKKESTFLFHFSVLLFLLPFSPFPLHYFVLSFFLSLLQRKNEERGNIFIPSLFTLFSPFLFHLLFFCPLIFLSYSIFIFPFYISKVIKEREQRPFFSFLLYFFPESLDLDAF
jgi:hypothetical protein